MPKPDISDLRTPSVAWPIPAALIALGIVLRVAEYLEPSSLWGDETMLALNVATRSYAELTAPLDYGQVSPVVFLWLERLAVDLLGTDERVFRLVPFLASGVSVPLFWACARRLIDSRAATVALGLIATSPVLVTYAGEAKPYATDFLVTTALLSIAPNLWCSPERLRSWLGIGLTASVAMFSSTPAIFTVLAVTAAAAAVWSSEQRRRFALGLALLTALYVVLFGVIYLTLLRDAAGSTYMQQFWARALISPGRGFLERLGGGIVAAMAPAGAALSDLGLAALFATLALVGNVALWRRGRSGLVAALTLPTLLAFGASFLGRYALHSRLMIYAAPATVCLVGVGVLAVGSWLESRAAVLRARWVATAFLFPSVVVGLAALAAEQPPNESIGPIVHELERRADPGAPVYVLARNTPAWVFYTTDWSRPHEDRVAWIASQAGPGGIAHENGASRGPRPPGEGMNLQYRDGARTVLVGVSSGSQLRAGQGLVPAMPDPNWAANEAERIIGIAEPEVWLVLVAYGDAVLPEAQQLMDTLRARHLEVSPVVQVGATLLVVARRK